MLFTPEQIRQIKQIIEDAHSAFIVNYLDVGAVSPATLKRLQSLGMVKTQQTAIKDVYLLGQVLAASKDPKLVAQSHAEVRRQLQQDPVPLLARVAAASSDPALRRMTPDDVRSAMQTDGYALLQRMAQATTGQPGAVAMPTPPASGQPPNLLPLMTRLVHQSQGPNYPDMSVARLKEQLRSNPIPLSEAEKQAVTMANERAAQYVVGLGNRVSNQTGQMVIEADAGLRRQLRDTIRTQTARNVAARETVARLKSDLGHATSDWTRDLDRIAVTEKQTAMQEGQAAAVAKRYGGKARAAKLTRPSCCPQCAAAYLENGRPRIFNLADLEANGSNVGRKQSAWRPTLAPLHPNCCHPSATIMSEFGYRRIDSLRVGERVYTHKGRLRPISHIWVSRYDGPMLHLRAYPHQTLKVTPNHPVYCGNTQRAAETVQLGHEVRCGLLSRFASPERPRLRHGQAHVRAMYGTTPEGTPAVAIVLGSEMFIHRGSLDRWLKGMERMQRPALEGIFIRRQKPDGTTTLEGVLRGPRDAEGRSVRRVKFSRCRPVGKMLYEEVDEMAPARATSTLLAKSRRHARARRAPVSQPVFHAVQTVHLLAEQQGTTTPSEHQIVLRLGHIEADQPEPHAEWRSPQEPITDVWQEPHRGAVYNLTVQDDHSYVAEGIVVGNCTCQLVSVPPGFEFNGQGEMVPSTSPSLQRSQKAKTVPAMRLRKAEPAPLPRPRLGATLPERPPEAVAAPTPERTPVRRKVR